MTLPPQETVRACEQCGAGMELTAGIWTCSACGNNTGERVRLRVVAELEVTVPTPPADADDVELIVGDKLNELPLTGDGLQVVRGARLHVTPVVEGGEGDRPRIDTLQAATAIARHFHEEYLAFAEAHSWETQERSRVAFDDLPSENRETMIATVRALLDRGLIRLPAPPWVSSSAPLVERIRNLTDIAGTPGVAEAMVDPVIAAAVRSIDSEVMYLGIDDAIHAIADEVEDLLRRVPAPTDGEICNDCGGPVDLVWWCHDDLLWEVVTGKVKPVGSRESAGGILCIQCFDRKAREVCPWIEWAPVNLRHLLDKDVQDQAARKRHELAEDERGRVG